MLVTTSSTLFAYTEMLLAMAMAPTAAVPSVRWATSTGPRHITATQAPWNISGPENEAYSRTVPRS